MQPSDSLHPECYHCAKRIELAAPVCSGVKTVLTPSVCGWCACVFFVCSTCPVNRTCSLCKDPRTTNVHPDMRHRVPGVMRRPDPTLYMDRGASTAAFRLDHVTRTNVAWLVAASPGSGAVTPEKVACCSWCHEKCSVYPHGFWLSSTEYAAICSMACAAFFYRFYRHFLQPTDGDRQLTCVNMLSPAGCRCGLVRTPDRSVPLDHLLLMDK